MPPALEAVCLKAMAREPGGRYASPKDLADDIEHWLADRPVTAWKEPVSVRLRRWLGRHRTLMAASLAVLLTAVVGLTVSAVFLSTEKNRTEAAHREAVANAGIARRQAELARSSELEAKGHQQCAERNLAVMRDAVDKFWLTRVSETAVTSASFLDGTANGQFVDSLVGGSLTFYKGLLDAKMESAFTPTEKARFLTCIGNIHYMYTQLEQAPGRSSRPWRRSSTSSRPSTPTRRPSRWPDYAPARYWLGYVLNDNGRYDESIPVLRKLIELVPKSSPAHNVLGYALNSKGRYDEAIPVLRKAVELDATNATAHDNLGWALIEKSQFDEAIAVLRKAIELNSTDAVAHSSLGLRPGGEAAV